MSVTRIQDSTAAGNLKLFAASLQYPLPQHPTSEAQKKTLSVADQKIVRSVFERLFCFELTPEDFTYDELNSWVEIPWEIRQKAPMPDQIRDGTAFLDDTDNKTKAYIFSSRFERYAREWKINISNVRHYFMLQEVGGKILLRLGKFGLGKSELISEAMAATGEPQLAYLSALDIVDNFFKSNNPGGNYGDVTDYKDIIRTVINSSVSILGGYGILNGSRDEMGQKFVSMLLEEARGNIMYQTTYDAFIKKLAKLSNGKVTEYELNKELVSNYVRELNKKTTFKNLYP